MSAMASLQDDPLVREILADEELMQKIRSGDYEALLQDPRMKALSQHPAVKGVSRSVNEAP